MRHVPSSSELEVLRSAPLLAPVGESVMREIEDEIEWLEVRAGDALFHEGEPGDALYIAIHGRLEVVSGGRILAGIKPKESIGEMALLTGETRSATVRAIRDSVVVRLSQARFEVLVRRHPSALLALTHLVIERLKKTSSSRTHAPVSNVFAVVPASREAPLARFTEALRGILEPFGPVLVVATPQPTAWLNEQEDAHAFVILQAEPGPSAWTERCIRHADHLLLIAEADHTPGELVADERLRSPEPIGAARRRELVLVHPDGTVKPSGTRRWLDTFQVDGHHHVRLGVGSDVRRLGRFLTGRAVALALGGGAARGAAHVGVIRALEEARVPIDLVCGTSVGAVIGSLSALGGDHGTIYRQVREGLVDNSIFDFTLPIVSFLAAKRTEALFAKLHGETLIEDLWRKFFCVSSNLTRASVVVHRTGLLRRAVRASGALSGLFPPVLEGGDLLVDGVLLNNLPADLVDEVSPCITIAVNLVPALDQTGLSGFEERSSPLGMLVTRMNPFSHKRPPLIVDVLMRSAFLGTVSAAKRIEREVDLYIEPPLERFSFLDARGFEPMVALGYETAKRRIDEWKLRDASVPRE